MKHPSLYSARKASQFLTFKLVSAVQTSPTSNMAAAMLRRSQRGELRRTGPGQLPTGQHELLQHTQQPPVPLHY